MLNSCCLQIMKHLRLVLVRERFAGFEFNEKAVIDDDIGEVFSDNGASGEQCISYKVGEFVATGHDHGRGRGRVRANKQHRPVNNEYPTPEELVWISSHVANYS